MVAHHHIHHHLHFPELGVRRLGEGAEGARGSKTMEAHIQVEQIMTPVCYIVQTKIVITD